MSKIYEFSGEIFKCIYNSKEFKIYAVNVDTTVYPDIKRNNFNNVSICGDLGELSIGAKYEITGEEFVSKSGFSYKILNIKRTKPITATDTLTFLREILTASQAETLYSAYPDIVERVRENRLDDIDLRKTKGIKTYTFNIIKEKIVENFCLADLVTEFKGYLSFSIIKKIYNKYTSIEKVKEELNKNPYKCLCGLSGVGFKTADAILLNIEKSNIIKFENMLTKSPERCLACLMYVLEENEKNGHTKMNLIDCRKEVISLVPECSDHLIDVIKNSEIYYNKDTMSIALNKTRDIEYYIATTILNAKKYNNKWICTDIEKYRTISNNIILSDEQLAIIQNVCENNIEILTANAGSGKSTAVKALINMLEDTNRSYILMTPTGKSSKVLAEFTNRKSSTIHRGLGYRPPNEWSFNKFNKLSVDIVIVDEWSMVDIYLCKRLFDAIDFKETKLLIIGDEAQLPSVSCGNLLHDFIKSGMIHITRLTKIFRYGEGGLMKIATDVRNGKPYLLNDMKNKATTFGNGDYMFIDVAPEFIHRNVIALYKKLFDNGYTVNDIFVLSAQKKGDYGTITLNNIIQKIANPNYGSDTNMRCGETTYYLGDLVIQNVNNYKAKIVNNNFDFWDSNSGDDTDTAFVANGETGVIIDINSDCLKIDFDGVVVKYNKAEIVNIGLGYAMTTHRSQGSGNKIVILITPSNHAFSLNSNLIYVGLTRMKEKCFHLGSLNTVNMAVKKKADLTRNTFMLEFLKTSF